MTREELDRHLVELMKTGRFDGMVRWVQKSTGANVDDASDAIYSAVVKLVERLQRAPVTSVTTWLTTVAVTDIKNQARVVSRRRVGPLPPAERETEDFADPYRVEDDVAARDLLRFLKEVVRSWPNRTMATVTELYLEAVFYDEPMSLVEAKEQTEQIIGETVSLGSIGTWKARGFDRLEEQLAAMGIHARATHAEGATSGERT